MRSTNGDDEGLSRTQRARRDDIVAAGIALIARDGYAAASIEKIALEAGTSKSTVLYHFKAKEAINEAIVAALFDSGAEYMLERIAAADGHRAQLHAYLTSNLAFIAENPAHVVAVHRISENGGLGRDGDDPVTPLARMLAAGQADGEFGSFDPHVLAEVVRAVVDGASFHFTEHPDLDVDHYVAEIIQLFDRATAPAGTDPIERQEP